MAEEDLAPVISDDGYPALPPEWISWVEGNLGRDHGCGANLLCTLLERGFHPVPSLEATGDFPVAIENSASTVRTAEICVLIASYRDPDCGPTLVDLFQQAAHPERIRVAVISQEEEDDRLMLPPEIGRFHSQIDVQRFKASESKGVCWARHHGQQMLQQESFALQLDSHMRFEPCWDLLLLATWVHCRDPRGVLTSYAPVHVAGGERDVGAFFGMTAKEFNADGILLFTGRPRYVPGQVMPERPMKGAFVSAHFLFGPAEFVHDVPYDPNLYFFGEEISLSARLWTHGFNIYHPNRSILYHDNDRGRRSTHFSDHRDWPGADASAKGRVRSLLGVPPLVGDSDASIDLQPFGLGSERSLADYERWSGINFAEKQIRQSAREGIFPAPIQQAYSVSARVLLAEDSFVVVDDFLPVEQYKSLREFLVCLDYKHINTSGKIGRAWHLQDRFPLRSMTTWVKKHQVSEDPKPDWLFPAGNLIDGFMQAVEAYQADHVPWIGERGVRWDGFSTTSWIYPPGTGLAMHTDGSNVYAGAYVYFLNDRWRSHWGGLLMVMNQAVNRYVADHELLEDGQRWYRRRWLHENPLEELMLEAGGIGQVIFPKANRIVFLSNDVLHMVSRVNEEAGDCVRLSLAGFFDVRRF